MSVWKKGLPQPLPSHQRFLLVTTLADDSEPMVAWWHYDNSGNAEIAFRGIDGRSMQYFNPLDAAGFEDTFFHFEIPEID